MKRIVTLCTVLTAVCLFSTAALAQMKTAVIDTVRCAMESTTGKTANEELKALEASRMQQLQPLQDELRKLDADFRAQEKVLTETARNAKLEELQKKSQEYQNLVTSFEAEIGKQYEERTMLIMKELEVIIAKVAKEGGYDMILQRQVIVYGPGVTDITEQVIKAYDASKQK